MKEIPSKFNFLNKYKFPIIILIVSMFVRIPRNLEIQGEDAFVVSFYGLLFAKGYLSELTLDPLSLFGLYPLSSYPILTELLLGGFFLLTGNIILSWYLLSFFTTLFGVIFTWKFVNQLNLGDPLTVLITVIYMVNPMFLLYSTGSIVTRATFMSIFPLFLLSLYLLIKSPNFKIFVFSLFTTLLMMLTHRVGMISIPLYLLAVILLLIGNSSNTFNIQISEKLLKISKKRITYIIFPLLYILLGIASTYFFPLNEQFVGISGFLKFEPGFYSFIELLIDQSLRAGISSFLSLLYIVLKIVDPSITKYDYFKLELFSLCLITFGFMALPLAWYVSLIFALPFSILSALFLIGLTKKFQNGEPYYLIISIFLIVLFSAFVFISLFLVKDIIITYFIIYIVILVTITIILMLFLPLIKFHKISHDIVFVPLLMVLTLHSMYYVDSLVSATNSEFPYSYLSDDEKNVAEFLENQNISGRVIASNFLIAKRIMGLTGILFYEDPFGGSGLISGYVNNTKLVESKQLKNPLLWWEDPSIFTYNKTLNIVNIKEMIFFNSFYSQFVQSIFLQEKTRYLVLDQDHNFTTRYYSTESLFIETVVTDPNSELIYNSTNLIVYKLPIDF